MKRAPTMVPHNKAPVDKMFDGKKYLAEWEQSSLGPYSIEPPDILRIKIANVSRIPSRSQHSDDQPLEDTYLVGPDGRVELGDWGSVYVTGLTPTKAANQIQRQLRKRVGCREAEVTVELPAPNSKVVYLITKSQNSGDNVVRMPYMPAMTITDLLDQAAPHTVDLDGAKITLRRRDVESVDQKSGAKLKADEIALKVDWDEKHDEPAEDTDYALFSGDRIVVTLTESPTKNEESIFPAAYQGERYVSPPAIRARRIDLNPSTGRIVARGIESIGNPQPSDVIFDIDLVTDPEGALIEFKSLKNGKGFVIADTETILPALRIMASHGIIEKFAWPRISCHVGQAANMVCSTTDHDDPWSAFRMDVTAEKLDTALALELKMASTKSPNDHDATLSVTVANDETLVVRADWWNEKVRGADKPVSSNVYVVVTPRLIK